jgi:hypothetical protein
MGNLASQQLTTQTDPDVLRRQILQDRERQLAGITNPQQQLAARLGGLLGGGLTNLYQDRGFFEVSDPLLTKVTQIQGVYNDVASRIDPAADPARFYSELQKAYGDAGLGREALAAANEAQKAKSSAMDFQLKETQLFEKNPELLAGRITTALESGNEAEANRLANLNARLTEDRELTLEAKKTAIAKDRAYISYQNKLANDEKFEYKPVDPLNPLAGNWKFDKSGRTDPQYVPVPAEIAAKFAPPAKDAKKTDKERAPLNTFSSTATTSAAAVSPSASSMNYLDGIALATGDATEGNLPVRPVSRLTPVQERDFAIQRAMPNVVVSLLTEEQKNVLAQNLGL